MMGGRKILKGNGETNATRGDAPMVGGGSLADPACRFRFEILTPSSIERFVVTKKSNDDIGFQSVQPLIGRGVGAKTNVTRSPSILGLVEGLRKVSAPGKR